MSKLMKPILPALALGLFMMASAQNLDMGAAGQSSRFEDPGKPKRGMTQAAVEASYGAPQSVREPVGDPPITRWEYSGFVVFFEYDKVIHAVSKR